MIPRGQRRPWLRSRPGRPLPHWRYRLLAAAGRWHRWRLRCPWRESALQRDFESGDPARQARVRAAADQILAALRRDDQV